MNPSDKLNARQLLFCEHLLKGDSQAEAYRRAGYNSNAPEREASDLMKSPKVSAYLREKREKLEETGDFTRADAIQVLKQVAQTDESGSARVSAVAQAAKMLGWNEPEKVDVGLTGLGKLLGRVRK
jgi:phage terminase small subunit